jgi:arylsulfatase A-like enzyme
MVPAALALILTVQQPATANRPPNVILVMADDLGYRELGSYGQTKIRTPNLDRLAQEGMRFTRFYSASTVCAPTRCSLLTGKHTGHAAVRGNKEVGGWGLNEGEGQFPLPQEETTLAELLRKAGYATACVGKWGLGGPGSEGHPLRQGFDFFFGYLCQRQAHNFTPTHLWRNHDVYLLEQNRYFRAHQRLEAPPAEPSFFDRYLGPQYAPEVTIEQAESWIRANKDRPFFLYFATTLPHAALQAPREWVDRYPRDWDREPYLGQNGYLPNARPRATYAAMISYLDDTVGRLMRLADELNLAEDTIFLFKADNGTAPNGGVDREFFASLGDLRGLKTNLYEGGIRVPFLARWKGRIPAGKLSGQYAASYDLLPTLLEWAGQPIPPGLDGISIAPVLMGKRETIEREALYFEYPEGPQQQAVLAGGLKLIRPNLRQSPERVELYDLEADPGETRNLAAQRPNDVQRLLALAARERIPSSDFPIPALDREAMPRRSTLPQLDLAKEAARRSVVDRERGQYLGHVSTLLLQDGSILAAYPKGHGKGPIVLKRSRDGGRTWSDRLPVPENWSTSQETPTLHALVDPQTGKRRLILWSGLYPARLASSEYEGRTWTALAPVGDWGGIVVMGSVERLRDGRYLAMFHDDGRFFAKNGKASGRMTLYQTLSADGGRTWSFPRAIFSSASIHLCEPGIVRSPDGSRLVALLRENRRLRNSYFIVSDDEGATWSEPRELPASLTGDRHTARYAPDGRLVVSFRDMGHESPTKGDWVAWVGAFDDLLAGREGRYRLRLMDNKNSWDCGYPGVEVLPDGTFVCTTYGHWEQGEAPYIVCVRFRLEELDIRLPNP